METQRGDNLLTALAAGCSASALTAFLTFPLDFLKTNQQLSNGPLLAKYNVNQSITSIAQFMTGSSALVAGSVLKNMTRITMYHWSSDFMAMDTAGNKKKTTAPRVVIAGAMSGFVETLWIVPFERIKIVMIQNRLLAAEVKGNPNPVDITGLGLDKHPKTLFARQYVSPHAYWTSELAHQYKTGKTASKFHHHHVIPADELKAEFNKTPAMSMIKAVRQMYALEGLLAFTTGTMITFARQVGTSMAWFSTFNATRQLINPHGKAAEPQWFTLNSSKTEQTFLYVVSAVAATAVTQPLDVIKSHMQLKNGRMLFRDSLLTAYKLVAHNGVSSLFAGAFPRGFKIAAHGALTAILYGNFATAITSVSNKSVFLE